MNEMKVLILNDELWQTENVYAIETGQILKNPPYELGTVAAY